MSAPSDRRHPATIHAFVVVSDSVAHESFSGRTLVDRHIEILARAGVTGAQVVSAADWSHIEGTAEWSGRRLVVRAERVFDARLYSHAIGHREPLSLSDGGSAIGLETIDGGRRGPSLDIGTLPTYNRELRRQIRPYWMRVGSTRDRSAVARLLVEASGKGHQDLPAAVINAPIEKAVTRRLADTTITPNQLTVVCNVVAYLVVLLLARGHFLSGAVGAMVVGVLDGLDGRQARVQVRTSELGRIEHLLDKVYEILWVVALAYSLSLGFTTGHYGRGVWIWIAAYLSDSAAYDIVKWRTGRQLDEISPTDEVIRLFAGRRNVYMCIFLACVLFGQPARAFTLILWWSLVTAAVHAQRAIWIVVLGDGASSSPETTS